MTDTLGLLLAVLVTAASVQDSVAGTQMIDQVAADHPGVHKVRVDGGCRQHLIGYAAALGIHLEIVQRTPGTMGFTPIPKRWTGPVARTHGWLMFHRRLARACETLPAGSENSVDRSTASTPASSAADTARGCRSRPRCGRAGAGLRRWWRQ